MKKILLLLIVSLFCLCGCESVPEETGEFDYDAMDKKFGQMQDTDDDNEDDSALYEEDMEEIQGDVTRYAEMLVTKSVELCVDGFPRPFIEMIMEERACRRDVARSIATSKIEEIFHSKEKDYRKILEVWHQVPHKVTIERIDTFPQIDALKEIYGNYGVTILDAIDIEFTISAGKHMAEGEIRLVQMDYGMWETDMSFFEI